MAARLLTVDLGNSRAKLRLWEFDPASAAGSVDDHRLLASSDALADADPRAHLDQVVAQDGFAGLEQLTCVALSSVVAEPATAAWVAALAGLGPRVVVAPDHGLDNRTRTPETVGHDRLFAARGAVARIGGSCLVLDAGSALTVDAVRVDARTGRAAFLGGAIAPGPRLLARALARGGARLIDVGPDPDAPALGNDTRAALVAGVSVGFFGAARELVTRIAGEAGLQQAPVVVTGGARAHLLARPLADREVFEVPDLVHLGLALATRDRLRAERAGGA